LATSVHNFEKKLLKLNNHPIVENSPTLVTLISIDSTKSLSSNRQPPEEFYLDESPYETVVDGDCRKSKIFFHHNNTVTGKCSTRNSKEANGK
jgi:hypothetical protein